MIGKFLKDLYYPHSKKYKLDMEKKRRNNRRYNDQLREIFNQELIWRKELIIGEYYHYRTNSAGHYGNVHGDHYIIVILDSMRQTGNSKMDNSYKDNRRFVFNVVQNNMTVNIGYTTLSRNILRFNVIDNNIEKIIVGTDFGGRKHKKLSANATLQEIINYEKCCEWMGGIRTHDLDFYACCKIKKPTR